MNYFAFRDNNNNNNNILNKEDLKQKNKFDVNKRHHNSMKYNNTNNKENNKNKKAFEVRLGDWTCSKCSNLNFAFRNKCNRCGMLKTVSEQQKMNIISQLNLNNYPMYMNMPPIINNNNEQEQHFQFRKIFLCVIINYLLNNWLKDVK